MTLSEAKAFSISWSCSKFAMGREDWSKYKEYLALKIPREIEEAWEKEVLESYYCIIKSNQYDENTWYTFSKMYNLAEGIRDIDSLIKMEAALDILIGKLNMLEKVIIAETIIGRRLPIARSGLIYLSYDLNDKMRAKKFARVALDLLDSKFSDSELRIRAEDAKQTCNNIIKELAL